MGQRGTKKIYVQVELTVPQDNADNDSPLQMANELMSHGRLTITVAENGRIAQDDEHVAVLTGLMTREQGLKLVIVGHEMQPTTASIEQRMKSSLSYAHQFKTALVSAGVEEERLSVYGIGPLAPSSGKNPPRLEILVLPRPD